MAMVARRAGGGVFLLVLVDVGEQTGGEGPQSGGRVSDGSAEHDLAHSPKNRLLFFFSFFNRT